MEVTFQNVTVTLEAPDAKVAYDKLCHALATLDQCEWTTDTYSISESEDVPPQMRDEMYSTTDLFLEEEP